MQPSVAVPTPGVSLVLTEAYQALRAVASSGGLVTDEQASRICRAAVCMAVDAEREEVLALLEEAATAARLAGKTDAEQALYGVIARIRARL